MEIVVAFLFKPKLNGRQLIDGPADNSQTWSNSLNTSSSFQSGKGAENAFDGDPSTICHGGSNATLTFNPGVTITGTEIRHYRLPDHHQLQGQHAKYCNPWSGWKQQRCVCNHHYPKR